MAIVLPRVTVLKRAALDLLFPRWCLGCGKEGDFICGDCRRGLPAIAPPVCPRCGSPLARGFACHDWPDTTDGIDGIRSPFVFDGVIRRAVHELKYRNLRALAPFLAGLLYEYLVANPIPADVLLPVPLHRKRLRERGYNQSALVAEELGCLCGLPVAANGLLRLHYTSPQARSAGVSERQRNVAGAFACPDARFRDKIVLLIDDVSTSGATLNACAGALKAAGAAQVWGLTLAREI
jgi:competence protein ComFC